MGVYDRQIALALRLIEAKGQLCQWLQPGAPTGTAAVPGPSGPPVSTDVRIVFLPSKGVNLASYLAHMPESDIPTGGIKALMATVPFTPSLVDVVMRGTEKLVLHRDNGLDMLAPNGEIVLWYLRFAR